MTSGVLPTEAKCLDHWAEHFQQLLNFPPSEGNDDLPNKPSSNDYPDTFIQPVTKAEVAAALEYLENDHNPGICSIMAELLKTGRASLTHWPAHIINEVWIRKELPDDLRYRVILPFWKHKDDKLLCSITKALHCY